MKKKIKILVLEDNSFFAGMLSESLKVKISTEVKVCENISSFFEVYDSTYDILILDYFLENHEAGTGQEVLKEIRKTDPEVPVIFLSSMEDIKTTVDVFHDGATDFIKKDHLFMKKLSSTIDKILKIKELKKEMETIKYKSSKFRKRVMVSFSAGILILGYLLIFC